MSSYAALPNVSSVRSIEALWRSGRLSPLRPLKSLWLLAHHEKFARVGRSIVDAIASLISEAAEAAPPAIRDVMRAELELSGGLGFTRLDVACPEDAPDEFQLLEVQAGDPSGMGWHDALVVALGRIPTLAPSHRGVFESLTQKRSIAFVVPKGSIVESDHRLLADDYSRNGWMAVCVEPRALHLEAETLFAGGQPVDAIFRDAFDELFIPESYSGGTALVEAVRKRAVVLMNPFSAGLADDKSLLEALSTPERWSGELGRVLRAHVPCTRVVTERRVDWDGRRVDLSKFLSSHRDQVVLKPVNGYGGFGVTVGPFATTSQWVTALENALGRPGQFVAQRYVPLPRQRVYTFGDDDGEPAYVVHSFWYHPRFVGAFVRASQNPVVNVHQGGGLAPVSFSSPLR